MLCINNLGIFQIKDSISEPSFDRESQQNYLNVNKIDRMNLSQVRNMIVKSLTHNMDHLVKALEHSHNNETEDK